jgi:hypothetical protein
MGLRPVRERERARPFGGAALPGKDENNCLYFFFGAGFLAAFLGILQAIDSSLGGDYTTTPCRAVSVIA